MVQAKTLWHSPDKPIALLVGPDRKSFEMGDLPSTPTAAIDLKDVCGSIVPTRGSFVASPILILFTTPGKHRNHASS